MTNSLREIAVENAYNAMSAVLTIHPTSVKAFLNTLSDDELSMAPVAGEAIWFRLNSEAETVVKMVLYWDIRHHLPPFPFVNFNITFPLPTDPIEFNKKVEPMIKVARERLFDSIPKLLDNSFNPKKLEDSFKTEQDIEKAKSTLRKLLKAIITYDGINDRLGFEIRSRLDSVDRAYVSEINDTSVEEITLKQQPKRALLALDETPIAAPSQNNLIGQIHFSFANHPELKILAIAAPVSITALCAFTLVCSRAKSISRMGTSLVKAIKYGITFIKGGDNSAITLEDGQQHVALRSIAV
jgi:hypothetical protein